MTAKVRNTSPSDVDVAAEWLARRRSGQMSLQEVLELDVWLESDPDHLAAYRSVTRAWSVAHSVSADPEILAMRETAVEHLAIRRRLVMVGSTAALAALLAVALYAAGLTGVWRDWVSPVSDQHIQTAIGQTIPVSLADGSTVMLDSDTTLLVHETWRRRDVTVKRGQAYFHVAKDPARPFSVSAANSSVTATGTQFDVRVDPDRLTVLLVEGTLHVDISASASQPAQETDMVAGWQLTASMGGERALVRLNAKKQARALGWQTGRLAFVRQSVSVVATELNRYSVKKIVVERELASIPIDGVFRAGDIDGFVRLLVKGHLARVLNNTDAAITLSSLKKTRPTTGPRVHDL